MDPASASVRSVHNKFCNHCEQYVHERTFRNHKQKFYNSSTGVWKREKQKTSTPCAIPDPLAGDSSEESECDNADYIAETRSTSDFQAIGHEGDETEQESSASDSSDESESSQSDPESDYVATEDDTQSQTHHDDDTEEEIWDGPEGEQQLLRDLYTSAVNDSTEPFSKAARSDPAVIVVTWLLTFLVIWQAQNHVSDNGLEHLMSFLCPVFETLGVDSYCLRGLSSLYLTWQVLGIDRDNFEKHCVCPNPKCCKLFPMDKLYEVVNGIERPRRCDNTWKVRNREVTCNTILSRQTVTTVSRRRMYYPLKVYCFKSIIESLESLVKKRGFEEKCEVWRDRKVSQAGLYGDIFEGKIWKDFQKWNGEDFLCAPRNYGLMANCDWFQPFSRRNDYSVGVIYMTVMNLPRSERFKLENVLLVGVIPALENEPKTLSSFLGPIVSELKSLWQGVYFTTYNSPYYPLKFRAALLCCAADIPASRKLCGFLGHAAELGCSKCKKAFKKVGTKTDYSGFERDSWPPRTNTEHRRHAQQINTCTSNAKRKRLEKQFGTRYTPLLELDYYEAVRFSVIDPMHNLFLGTAKRMFKTWVDREVLKKTDLESISSRIESVMLPPGMGRVPKRISSNFGAFTAEEWKNWTLYYSTYCLDGILPTEHMDCWQLFVLACKRICKPVVTESDINYADAAFVSFGKRVERLYDKLFVTPNMHLHCHLKSCITDYGPVYGFWLFSFERYNGMLGSVCTNNRGIEMQLMRKFLISGFAHSIPLPTKLHEVFAGLFDRFYSKTSYSDIQPDKEIELLNMADTSNTATVNWAEDDMAIKVPVNFNRVALSSDEKSLLASTYESMYPESRISDLANTVRKYGSCQVGQEHFGSRMASRSKNSANVVGRWADDEGTVDPASAMRPGVIQCFYRLVVQVNDNVCSHVFAVIKWHKSSPMKDKIGRGRTCTVWQKAFVRGGAATFIPVQRIHGKAMFAESVLDTRKVVIVCPVIRKTLL